MATNTNLQSLNAGDSFPSNRRQYETFLAGEAIAIGDAVALDFAQASDADKALYVKKAGTAAKIRHFVGVAVEAAASGDKVRCVISGIVSCKVAAGSAADTSLEISGTGGELVTYANTSVNPIAVRTISAEAAGSALVVVLKQF